MDNVDTNSGESFAPAIPPNRPVIKTIAIVAVACLLVVGLVRLVSAGGKLMQYTHQPLGIMSTDCTLVVVTPANQYSNARKALHDAEARLRNVESRMNIYIEHSELSNFNSAQGGEKTRLSPQTLAVLLASKDMHIQSGGAFDVTIGPVVRLWKSSARTGSLPTPQQISQARQASSWNLISIEPDGVVKQSSTVAVDLGGIAKGFAVDEALEAMALADVTGGMVNLGGNIRVFGDRTDGKPWTVGVKNPFDPQNEANLIAKVILNNEAIATSAHYNRFVTIAGRNYSHIIDPRTGAPADQVASVTVIAPTAMQADGWSTTLAVLGPEGLRRLPKGVDALVITGNSRAHRLHATEGFAAKMVK